MVQIFSKLMFPNNISRRIYFSVNLVFRCKDVVKRDKCYPSFYSKVSRCFHFFGSWAIPLWQEDLRHGRISITYCWRRTRANTRKRLNAQRATAQCSADAQTGQTGRVYRSDRLSPSRPAVRPTNVAREGPVGAGARRVVIGSAGHLERTQSM